MIFIIFQACRKKEICGMNCYHCGDKCETEQIKIDSYTFCCNGCKSVFEILHQNGLAKFYELGEKSPGVRQRGEEQAVYYDFLDLDEYQRKYILFEDENLKKVQLYLPQIHCNSCIWLLENISKVNPEILTSEVDFSSKIVQFTVGKSYDLKSLALFLEKLGYPPDFSPNAQQNKTKNKQLVYKIGVAGFCFGNIMLFSFPEYLGLENDAGEFRKLFLCLSFFLSIPALFYAGFDYLKYAYYGLKNKVFNMELPIAIGLIALFLRSTYELIDFDSQAYFDSLAGLIFFLLIGKWYQEKTFSTLRFETDKESYFPMAVQTIRNGKVSISKTEDLKIGMNILIRNYELVPTDAILLKSGAKIDYSFVTGESDPVNLNKGDMIYAGGRLLGEPAKMQVVKSVNEGYLTGLWNANTSRPFDEENQLTKISNQISRYFTIFILLLSLATATYWFFSDASLLWRSVVAVLIVACPCALALSIPFTYGNALRMYGKRGLYFRKSDVIDQLTGITTIVFDKTGTLTTGKKAKLMINGDFTAQEIQAIYSGCSNSIHPLSQTISKYFDDTESITISSFQEIEGSGITFSIEGDEYRIGSARFVEEDFSNIEENTSYVFIKKNKDVIGHFIIQHTFRSNLKSLNKSLNKKFNIYVLSGDNDRSADLIRNQFGIKDLCFNQTPSDKASFIRNLQENGDKVLMIGDGINDGQALSESYFGIAVSNSAQGFRPSCDAILEGDAVVHLDEFLRFANFCKRTVIASFIISLVYNVVGLTIAVQGIFAPVFAAILMPLSSVSVVLFATFSIQLYSRRMNI